MQKQWMNLTINYMLAASTTELQMPQQRWIVAKMVNVQWKVMTEKIAAKKKVLQKWIVAKMVSAPWKDMTEKIVVKKRIKI